MINSLSKDSHITRGNCYSKRSPLQKSVSQNSGNSALVCKSGINNVKPGEPSFCGFFNMGKVFNKVIESNGLKKVLEFSDDQPLVFGSAFSILLTFIFSSKNLHELKQNSRTINAR